MPSFDVVSEIDQHELTNAVDQANREIGNRFDFKNTDSRVEQEDNQLTLFAPTDFQVDQVLDILRGTLAKRKIDMKSLKAGDKESNVAECRMPLTIQQGIDQPLAKKITTQIKSSKMKVQAAIQGDQVRVTAKKRDDLQSVMAMLRKADLDMPLQFNNFRD
ncbi:MAG: YajQ family cyclic di-GMP-binding protein [Immundisolibacteraceae bacterium]|nr:YajQ family cyclic di-GMP-binding protein [Immundisolibacteraceae bacterium]